MQTDFKERIDAALACIRDVTSACPRIGVVLGSGLSEVSESTDGVLIPFDRIRGMPAAAVAGQRGEMKIGARVVTFAGRRHYYEGGDSDDTVFPIALMKAIGVAAVILTNAAGAVNTDYRPGDIVLLKDHINFMGFNPLRGPNDERLGPRFPDMSDPYPKRLRRLAQTAAAECLCGIRLEEGVYMGFNGPSYETPAEIRMARVLGADLVGMSTVPEVIVANYLGIGVIGLSCVTNMAAGILDQPLNHAEVIETGRRARERMEALIAAILGALEKNSR
jgi:purine-nucleoside phosphorylase